MARVTRSGSLRLTGPSWPLCGTVDMRMAPIRGVPVNQGLDRLVRRQGLEPRTRGVLQTRHADRQVVLFGRSVAAVEIAPCGPVV
jgi:hypothetical protein